MTELRPCPFCKDGGKPYAFTEVDGYADEGSSILYRGSVGCEVCRMGIEVWHEDYDIPDEWRRGERDGEVPPGFLEDLIQRWNTRAERTCNKIPYIPLERGNGQPAIRVVCSECGARIGALANFCRECGAKVVEE